MPATYEPIATTTLGSAASTITFSSIPATYTDLRLVIVGTSTNNNGYTGITFNSDTATNYSDTAVYGQGTTTISSRRSNQAQMPFWGWLTGISSTIPSMGTMDLFSYAGSTYKTALMSDSNDKNGSGSVLRNVGLWRSTAAVTRIDLINQGSTFMTGTRATLYGILKA